MFIPPLPACGCTTTSPTFEDTIKKAVRHRRGVSSGFLLLKITRQSMDSHNLQSEADELSVLVARDASDIDGLCHGYELRRHKHQQNANEGSLHCREDWTRYIGPIERWGNCNPYEGHFAAVVLPMCKPERLPLVSYIFECKDLPAFLGQLLLDTGSRFSRCLLVR